MNEIIDKIPRNIFMEVANMYNKDVTDNMTENVNINLTNICEIVEIRAIDYDKNYPFEKFSETDSWLVNLECI